MHEVRLAGENIPRRATSANGQDVFRDNETSLAGLEVSYRRALLSSQYSQGARTSFHKRQHGEETKDGDSYQPSGPVFHGF